MPIIRAPGMSDEAEEAFTAVLRVLNDRPGQEAYDALINAMARLLMVHSDSQAHALARAEEAGENVQQTISRNWHLLERERAERARSMQ